MAAYRSDLNMSTTLFLNTRNLSSIYASLDRFSAHIEWWPAVLQTYNMHTHTLTHTHDCTIPSSVKREMYCCSDLRQTMRLYSRQLHCKRKKTQVQRGEIRLFLIAKGYRLIHWMKALKQATVTLQNTTKKDTVKFPRKKCHSIRKKAYIWKSTGGGAYLHHDQVSRDSTKTNACRPPHSGCLKMFYKRAVNKERALDVPIFHFSLSKRRYS